MALGLRYGKLCAECTGRKCVDAPTPGSPLWIQCPRCDGSDPDCPSCDGNPRGVAVTQCPKQCVTSDIWRLVRAADDSRLGLLPVAGGTLDQTESVMRAMTLVRSEEAPYRVRSGLND